MMKILTTFGATLALTATMSAGYAGEGRKDLQVFNDISKAVTRYAQFTIFDSVDASVKDGVVTLTGRVTMPYKKDAIEKRVSGIDGVKLVHVDTKQLGRIPDGGGVSPTCRGSTPSADPSNCGPSEP